jgi:hypothetical protein
MNKNDRDKYYAKKRLEVEKTVKRGIKYTQDMLRSSRENDMEQFTQNMEIIEAELATRVKDQREPENTQPFIAYSEIDSIQSRLNILLKKANSLQNNENKIFPDDLSCIDKAPEIDGNFIDDDLAKRLLDFKEQDDSSDNFFNPKTVESVLLGTDANILGLSPQNNDAEHM